MSAFGVNLPLPLHPTTGSNWDISTGDSGGAVITRCLEVAASKNPILQSGVA
jgi:hypothetical protein